MVLITRTALQHKHPAAAPCSGRRAQSKAHTHTQHSDSSTSNWKPQSAHSTLKAATYSSTSSQAPKPEQHSNTSTLQHQQPSSKAQTRLVIAAPCSATAETPVGTKNQAPKLKQHSSTSTLQRHPAAQRHQQLNSRAQTALWQHLAAAPWSGTSNQIPKRNSILTAACAPQPREKHFNTSTLQQHPCSSILHQRPSSKAQTCNSACIRSRNPGCLATSGKPFNQHIPQTRGPQRLAGLLVALLEKQPFRLPQGIEVTHLEKNWLVVETPVQPAGNMFETSWKSSP